MGANFDRVHLYFKRQKKAGFEAKITTPSNTANDIANHYSTGHFVRYPNHVLESDAVAALPLCARRLMDGLAVREYPGRNGFLGVGRAAIKRLLKTNSDDLANRAIQSLIDAHIVFITQPQAGNRQRLAALTWMGVSKGLQEQAQELMRPQWTVWKAPKSGEPSGARQSCEPPVQEQLELTPVLRPRKKETASTASKKKRESGKKDRNGKFVVRV